MRSVAKLAVLSIIVAVLALADDTPQVTSSVQSEEVLPSDVLTNQGVVLLSNAGFSDGFIAEKIQLSRARLDCTVQGLTYLRHNSVSEDLIRYIMERTAQPSLALASRSAPAPTPAPALVPMKVVKRKMLVPQIMAAPALVAVPTSSGVVSAGMSVPMYSKKATYYGWYVPPAASYGEPGYPQPTNALPGSSVMPGSTFVGSVSAGWLGAR